MSGWKLRASREIATFDAEDFALPTGSWPYESKDFSRIDNSDDSEFYSEPRFVKHIDDRAIESLTAFYREEFHELSKANGGRPLDVLDLCSSWISHFPDDIAFGNVVGIG